MSQDVTKVPTMSRIHLRMAGYVVTLALHLINGLYMKSFHTKELLEDPDIRTFVRVQYRYITTWNFLFQMLYALIGLSCDWLTLKNSSNKKYKAPSFLTDTRDTLYSAIIWPSTFLVATLFWPFYLYDFRLVYPIFIDKVLTRLSNHIMHSFIVPIAMWEMLARPQKRPPSEARIVGILLVYTVAYWVVLFYTYIEQDYWIYPIFKYLQGTIYFPLLICYTCTLIIINYKLQWIVIAFLYPTEKNGKKGL